MVAFVTLFLGLILGSQTFELAVEGPVAKVELYLDGELCGERDGPPWVVTVDLGPKLVPHHLRAVALDADGRELGHADQWLNVPHRESVADLVLSPGDNGKNVTATVVWESTVGGHPEEITVSFDGRPLEVDDPERILLPPHDPEELHLLQVELRFADNYTAVADKVFGGAYSDEVQTELTAVPVVLGRNGKTPPVEALAGWFVSRDGTPLRVVAIEEGPAEIVVVRDLGAQHMIDQLVYRRQSTNASWSSSAGRGLAFSSNYRYLGALKKDQRVQFLFPVPEHAYGRRLPRELFPVSAQFRSTHGGLIWLMTQVRQSLTTRDQRLAEAVAVAGLAAARRNRRRAVVLVVGEQPEDASAYSPEMARRYLESLRVPFAVWSIAGPATGRDWGAPTDVSNLSRLKQAIRSLSRDLKEQRIVWLEGRHLPQEIALAPAAELALAK